MVRPRRHVILFAPDSHYGDRLRFTLETRLLVKCSQTDDPDAFRKLISTADGVVIFGGGPVGEDAALILDDTGFARECTLVVTRKGESWRPLWEGYVHEWDETNRKNMITFLDAVRIMVVKKRGPKPRKDPGTITWLAVDAS